MIKSLYSFCKFLNHHHQNLPRTDLMHVIDQVINIFNIFISVGESFIVDREDYYEILYEIVRNYEIFEELKKTGFFFFFRKNAKHKIN